MNRREILTAAKQLIETRGWAKGDEQVFAEGCPHGFCVATAVTKTLWDNISAQADVLRAFREANGIEPVITIGAWNDAPERTKEQVLAAFDKAIEACA